MNDAKKEHVAASNTKGILISKRKHQYRFCCYESKGKCLRKWITEET
jgi:hypothetical protein